MNIEKAIRKMFQLKEERGWDTLYVMVDVHGVIVPSSYSVRTLQYEFISDSCKEVLQWFTKRKDFKLIMWTSSYPDEIAHLLEWLEKKHGIVFDYVNGNPECLNTPYADFSKKPYFNLLLDDKAGMTPEIDWLLIGRTLEMVTDESVIEWTPVKKQRLSEGLSHLYYSLAPLAVFS